MKEKKNKREWIKTAAIIFLSIMLVLTFFSNTIMNYSLPVVATEYVQSGSIVSKIRGTGVVEGTDPYLVKMQEDEPAKIISSIEVRAGQHVETGQVLMRFSSKKVVGLEEAQKEVKQAQDGYDSMVKDLETAVLKGYLTNSQKDDLLKGITGKYSDYLKSIETLDAQIKKLEKEGASYEEGIRQCELFLSLNSNPEMEVSSTLAAMNETKEEYDQAVALDPATPGYAELVEGKRQAYEAAVLSYNTAFGKKTAYDQQVSAKTQYEYMLRTNKDNLTALYSEKEAINTKVDNENTYYERVKNATQTLEDAKSALAKLENPEGINEICAPISGTVDEIHFKSGEEVSAGQTLLTMQPDGKGYTMSFSVTNEQARNVAVGDYAELVNAWYYYDVYVRLASIKPDKSDPGKKKMLTFDVTGDVTSGQSLSVSVGQRSANYDLIVPNSAIKEDSNGKFILIIESKSSPLGNRYMATRVDVQVLASDDTKSAISGALNGWEYVITTANKPVEAGKQVRLADE